MVIAYMLDLWDTLCFRFYERERERPFSQLMLLKNQGTRRVIMQIVKPSLCNV